MLLPSLSILLTIMTLTAAQLVFPNLDHEQLAAAMQTHDDKPYDDFVRAPRLSDVMTLEPQASIFFSYARESARFSRILSGEAGSEDGDWDGDRDDGDGNGDGKMYTVFVPMNRAVMALPRKPHQGRAPKVEIPVEITEQDADRQSLRNVEQWVGAHIVPEDLSDASSLVGPHATLLDKQTITLSHPEGKEGWKGVVLEPGNAIIVGKREAANGVMYLIDGTVEINV